MRKEVYITVVILALLCACMSQATKKGRERSTSSRDAAGFSNTPKSPMGILDTIAYQILGGPQDASILTRIGNKIGQIATVLIGSLFGYFKFFRNRKNRQERINEYFGDEKHGFAVDADKQIALIGQKVAEKIIYDFNSEKKRMMAVKSGNGQINFNIDIVVEDVQEESVAIYKAVMKGSDPEGNSIFTGFVTFKNKLLEVRLEQTYQKNDKKDEQRLICYFSGKQVKEDEQIMQGDWWIEGQRGTIGSHSGTWTFTF